MTRTEHELVIDWLLKSHGIIMDFLVDLLKKERILIKVKITGQKTRVLEYVDEGDYFLVAVNAPPVDGKANAEIEKYFSRLLKKNVKIKSGHTSKKKVLVMT